MTKEAQTEEELEKIVREIFKDLEEDITRGSMALREICTWEVNTNE